MGTMNITQPPQIGYGGEDITTNTMAVIEMKHKRANKRKDRGGDTINMSTAAMKQRKDYGDTNTSTVTEKNKRPYKRKDYGDTNTSTVTEKNKRPCKRKDYGDTNTSTVTEKNKRPYKRKDCGDANTSTVTVKNKRPYIRKDCGDSNTSTVTVKKKRAYRRKDCIGTNTPTVMEKKKRPYIRKKYLPHGLIVEEILTKLPVPTLLKSVLVSKLWYNSIHIDHKRFTYSHFLQSQKQPDIILSLLNVRDDEVVKKTGEPRYGSHFFKFTCGMYNRENDNALQFNKFRGGVIGPGMCKMVGYCHGLPCMAAVGKCSTAYIILDPNRKDFLHIYPAVVETSARIICHGFGFDPSANEYKLVSIFLTTQKELNVVVFTLGTKSWRNITATSTPISGHGGCTITAVRAPTDSDRSAIFCTSGSLVWKIIATLEGAGSDDNSNAVSNEMEMLLSFNLHDEKFQFIQLPAKSTTTEEQQKHLLIDYPHLLEFKGSPCIARIEKLSGNGSDYHHRCCGDHKGSSSCCCCCKVHLYVLKDNVKQVWVKEESFDVRINSTPTWSRNLGHLTPVPCCFCFNSTTATPTRIYSFSNQILLYWFNGDSLQVYNLRSEKLQLVIPFDYREVLLFQAKMKEPRHKFYSGDDDIYCSNMDYQLHCHEENFLSLQTFIPEGVEGVAADDFRDLDLERCSAYMFIYRGSKVYHPFFN